MQSIRCNVAGCHTKSSGGKHSRHTWTRLGEKNHHKLCLITAYQGIQEKGAEPMSENAKHLTGSKSRHS